MSQDPVAVFRPCRRCGTQRPPGRTRYCSDECSALATADKEAARALRRMEACKNCGGPKEPGVRGSRLCATCREKIQDASALIDRERRRRKRLAEVDAKLARGETVLHHPLRYKDGDKWCPRCQDYRPLDAFPIRKDTNKKVAYCRPCQKAYNQERRFLLHYGLTWDEYEFLLAAQDYRCAICRGKPRKNILAVDHDHKTGEIRGLLCSRCNHRLLGSANDDPARLRRAAEYLEEFAPREVFGARRVVPGFKADET